MLLNKIRGTRHVRSKVKLVAIAKDEATYLPEWIHHHLYFGFDNIEIHINRTSDNSIEVLNDISKKYPNVTWRSADWVDKCPGNIGNGLQLIVYSLAWEEALRTGDYTHVMFIDIDEFWIHQSFNTNIHQYLEQFPKGSVISFEWLCDLGDLNTYSPLPQTLNGNLAPLVKTVYPTNAPVKKVHSHVAAFDKDIKHLLANKEKFVAKKEAPQAVRDDLNSLKQAFIYHRVARSEKEYISLVLRGNPNDGFPFKTNRFGMPVKKASFSEYQVPNEAYKKYSKSYESFLSEVNYKKHISAARAYVEQRFDDAVKLLPRYIESDYEIMLKIFKRVRHEQIVKIFTTYKSQLVAAQPKNVDSIYENSA